MVTGPEEGAAAGRGRLRATHADREHVIETLKRAFTDGRLDKDELGHRVGQTLAARTYAELATVTADLPVRPAQAPPPRPGARRPVTREAVKWGLVGTAATIPPAMFVAALFGVWQLALLSFPLLFIELIVAMVVVGITLARQRNDRLQVPGGQPPAQPGQSGRVTGSGPHGSTGHQPSPHQTRADLPVRRLRRDQQYGSGRAVLVSRGAGLVTGAA